MNRPPQTRPAEPDFGLFQTVILGAVMVGGAGRLSPRPGRRRAPGRGHRERWLAALARPGPRCRPHRSGRARRRLGRLPAHHRLAVGSPSVPSPVPSRRTRGADPARRGWRHPRRPAPSRQSCITATSTKPPGTTDNSARNDAPAPRRNGPSGGPPGPRPMGGRSWASRSTGTSRNGASPAGAAPSSPLPSTPGAARPSSSARPAAARPSPPSPWPARPSGAAGTSTGSTARPTRPPATPSSPSPAPPASSARDGSREPLDGWRGDPEAIINRLLATQAFTEPYYEGIARTVLRHAVGDRPPRSFSELVARLDKRALQRAARDDAEALEAIRALPDKDVAGVRARYEGIAWAVGTTLDGTWSYEDTRAAYVPVGRPENRHQAAEVGAFLLEDILHWALARKEPRPPSARRRRRVLQAVRPARRRRRPRRTGPELQRRRRPHRPDLGQPRPRRHDPQPPRRHRRHRHRPPAQAARRGRRPRRHRVGPRTDRADPHPRPHRPRQPTSREPLRRPPRRHPPPPPRRSLHHPQRPSPQAQGAASRSEPSAAWSARWRAVEIETPCLIVPPPIAAVSHPPGGPGRRPAARARSGVCGGGR